MADLPLTVAVPTRNRAGTLLGTLNSVLAQLEDRDELLIADDGSDDASTAAQAESWLAAHWPRGRLLRRRNEGISATRNALLQASTTSVVCFLDDDVRADHGWLGALRRSWSEAGDRVAAIGGPMQPAWEEPRPAWLRDDVLYVIAILDLGPLPRVLDQSADRGYLWGGNLSLRRRAALSVGGFDPLRGARPEDPVARGEEEELQRRLAAAGWECRYDPGVRVEHLVARERLLPGYFRAAQRHGGRAAAEDGACRAPAFVRLVRGGIRFGLGRALGDRPAATHATFGLAYAWALLTSPRGSGSRPREVGSREDAVAS